MKIRLLAGLLCASIFTLASTLCAEPRQLPISQQDAQEVIAGSRDNCTFIYFGKELCLDSLAGQEMQDFAKLIKTIAKLAPDQEYTSAFKSVCKRIDTGSSIAPKALAEQAILDARELLIAHHAQIADDTELRNLNSQLEIYRSAIEDGLLTISINSERSPRPPLDTGDAASTGNVGDQFFPTPANGISLPDDVNVVHNLTVGNDLTVGGNLVINGTVTYHGDVILQPICPDPDIAIRFNTCTGTEIARIYTPSVVGGIAISTNGGVTENFRVQADGNSQVTGTLELPTGYVTTGGDRYINNVGTESFFAGVEAGNTANTGLDNTGVGFQALTAITTGFGNTGMGYRVLPAATSGFGNTGLGSQALQATITTNNNTGIGAGALFSSNTDNNTALGANAGLNLTTGSNNIYIGYNEVGSATDANTIRIGANATLAATKCFVGGIDGIALPAPASLVGITSKQLGTTDASGFTLGGTLTTSNAIYANGGVDRSTAATLSLGATNANAINIGNGAATVDITGSTISHIGLTEITAGNEIQFFNPLNTFHSGIKAGALGANTTTLVLPLANGAANNVLTNDGAANLSWNSVAGLGAFVQNGNAFGVPAVLGTTDAQPLIIRTGVGLTPAQTRMTFASTGEITAATVLYADAGVDRSAAATLSLGTTNATTVTIGNVANTTAVELPYGYATTGGIRYINNFGTTSYFAGKNAGNTALLNTGTNNTGIGYEALTVIESGNYNTAVGAEALANLRTAMSNTAVGESALRLSNSRENTAVGTSALSLVSGGERNTSLGVLAGSDLYSGSNNIYLGAYEVAGGPAESNTIRIGANATLAVTTCYIGGIRDITTTVADAIPVLISSTGQLGTVSSARRYKENIQSLDNQDRFMQLNPVTFNYKSDATHRMQYGFVAEEVETIYPELTIYNKDGQIETVAYHQLYAILTKEIQTALERIQTRAAEKDLQAAIERINALEAKLAALEN